jgi:hypothetical protein
MQMEQSMLQKEILQQIKREINAMAEKLALRIVHTRRRMVQSFVRASQYSL